MEAKRKQYDLKHIVTGTIQSVMGSTLVSMDTEIYHKDTNFRLWYIDQLVVISSWKTEAKNIILVGKKINTFNYLKMVPLNKNQWCEYMQQVIYHVTINSVLSQDYGNNKRGFSLRNHTHLEFAIFLCTNAILVLFSFLFICPNLGASIL